MGIEDKQLAQAIKNRIKHIIEKIIIPNATVDMALVTAFLGAFTLEYISIIIPNGIVIIPILLLSNIIGQKNKNAPISAAIIASF